MSPASQTSDTFFSGHSEAEMSGGELSWKQGNQS